MAHICIHGPVVSPIPKVWLHLACLRLNQNRLRCPQPPQQEESTVFNGMWVVVRIMVPFWIPIIVRHLIFRVPKKGP